MPHPTLFISPFLILSSSSTLIPQSTEKPCQPLSLAQSFRPHYTPPPSHLFLDFLANLESYGGFEGVLKTKILKNSDILCRTFLIPAGAGKWLQTHLRATDLRHPDELHTLPGGAVLSKCHALSSALASLLLWHSLESPWSLVKQHTYTHTGRRGADSLVLFVDREASGCFCLPPINYWLVNQLYSLFLSFPLLVCITFTLVHVYPGLIVKNILLIIIKVVLSMYADFPSIQAA